MQKLQPSSYSKSYELFHHHVSWQASELLFLHHSIAKFDQQSNFPVEDDLMHKTSVFQVSNLRTFWLENW
jgi:hypothetical protein